jgi:hypothetical protein
MPYLKLPRCVKCNCKCVTRCYFCNDPVCYYHSHLEGEKTRICNVCGPKYYRIWLEEKDYEYTTELEYKEWLKEQIAKCSDTQ